MDLITNNLDAPASIIENKSNGNSNFIQFKLFGESPNPIAIGSKVTLYTNYGIQYQELFHGRGFQSSVEPLIHFGLGDSELDSVRIEWYDGSVTVLNEVEINSKSEVKKGSTKQVLNQKKYLGPFFLT